MNKRHINSLGADVSLLGFGLMRLPVLNNDKAKIDYKTAGEMVEQAFKGGINYFDTAYVYHEKKSEAFAGQVLADYPRDSYYLATKMPTWEAVSSEAAMEDVFAEQLKLCRVDYFDFYLVHALHADHMDQFTNFHVHKFLSKKKAEGKIRRLGFSFHDGAPLLRKIIEDYTWDFVQLQINYLDWEPMDCKSFYQIATEHGLPVIVMEPVKGGILANPGDKVLEILKKADPGASSSSWALRFPASLPNVVTVLSGMTAPRQMTDNIKTFASFKPLTEQEHKVLEDAAAAFRASGTIPCTGCRYCMDCPAGVDIPKVFAHYNFYQLTKNENAFGNHYRTLLPGQKANNCAACGQCLSLCPQHIAIPDHMKEITAFTAGLNL